MGETEVRRVALSVFGEKKRVSVEVMKCCLDFIKSFDKVCKRVKNFEQLMKRGEEFSEKYPKFYRHIEREFNRSSALEYKFKAYKALCEKYGREMVDDILKQTAEIPHLRKLLVKVCGESYGLGAIKELILAEILETSGGVTLARDDEELMAFIDFIHHEVEAA
jgi:hypothetical protein